MHFAGDDLFWTRNLRIKGEENASGGSGSTVANGNDVTTKLGMNTSIAQVKK